MKESRKQIAAQVRNEVAKQYKMDIERWRQIAGERWDMYIEECKKRREIEAKVEALEEQNRQYKDWIERLQEFCNMPDGEREKAIEAFRAEQKAKHQYAEFVGSLDFFKNALGFMLYQSSI